ncbi:MAG: biotin transporter BioY [Crenarchaeota archaeon]|nr:biotin transporter BioY [Thermoproteota archaeon]
MSLPDITIDHIRDFIVENAFRIEDLLKSEKQLVEINSDKIVVVGDLHGDYLSLCNIVSRYSPSEWTILFLGDYVDRGEYQIETITKVLELKVKHPDKVFLLRGNHESPSMNITYGFVAELQTKFKGEIQLMSLIYSFLEYKVFCNLPYAALINNEIFAVHGGLAKGLEKPDDVKNIPKCDAMPSNPIAFQLLWNDPSDEVTGFEPNELRGGCLQDDLCIYLWGPDVTKSFLEKNSLKMIIRAHEYTGPGYKWNHNGKVLTVFSSCAGPYKFVRPKIAIITRGEVKLEDARK